MERSYPIGSIENMLKQISGLQLLKEKTRNRFDELTAREVEVLTLIAKGMNNPAIADNLDISRATVQNHRAKIRDKLGISSQVGFVKYALAHELITF